MIKKFCYKILPRIEKIVREETPYNVRHLSLTTLMKQFKGGELNIVPPLKIIVSFGNQSLEIPETLNHRSNQLCTSLILRYNNHFECCKDYLVCRLYNIGQGGAKINDSSPISLNINTPNLGMDGKKNPINKKKIYPNVVKGLYKYVRQKRRVAHRFLQ